VELQPGEPLVAVSRAYHLQESWRTAMNQRPDLLEAKLDAEKAGIQLKYYKNQVFPQLDLVGSYGLTGSRREFGGALDDVHNGNLPFYSYGAQLTIPLGNVTARNRFKQGKLTVEQSLLTVKKIEQDVMVQVDNAIKAAQAAFERVDATHEARLYAEAALEAEQKKLENGKSTSFIVLQLQTNLTTARSNEIRALADYNEALTGLAQAEASTLERRKIDIQAK
jgi:outer membrane protein TolC